MLGDPWIRILCRYTAGSAVYINSQQPYTDNLSQLRIVKGFVQIVWKATTNVGCGIANGTDDVTGSICWVAVCRYSPQGATQSNTDWLKNVYV